MKAISLSAQADSFQLTINWNAVKSNVALIGHKVINLVVSETFATIIASISTLASWWYLITDHPLRFAVAIVVACFALARVIVPMAKGGEA